MRQIGRFLMGLLIGWFVGSLVGLLLAPEPGSNTQQRIAQAYQKFLSDIREAANARRRELEQELERLRKGGSTQSTP
ncbi:YtxH domain-containing protein [Thermanaerothrix sp. 4228-RoL]|uniref:YtxH domain-containing protein n=1 Tax=Thermanaerothrix solaris TaxID=3058434 RepID=A0ABU3NKE4_9CHLR|nr:YtxH domain-containing protein [Thermanaerothrix sp. 4228-RoL]MDT8897320.1 YtxH domain-containing protein [Thermanaerothrix sp. 4228-RoL]